MSEEDLKFRLTLDLEQIGMPISEVDMFLRPYSSTYYGRYFPVYDDKKVRPRLFIYPYENKSNSRFIKYSEILKTAIHELCHHIQYSDSSFVRCKGVMHNTQFWQLYNHYIKRAKKYKILEVKSG